MLHQFRTRSTHLVKTTSRFYQRMTTEEYLLNTREALTNTTMQKAKLRPLLEASKLITWVKIINRSHCWYCHLSLFNARSSLWESSSKLFHRYCSSTYAWPNIFTNGTDALPNKITIHVPQSRFARCWRLQHKSYLKLKRTRTFDLGRGGS